MSLYTLLKVQKLQAALHAKAKGSSRSQWRGELAHEQRLWGPTHGTQAATVVAQEAQGAGTGNTTLPGRILYQELNLIRLQVWRAQLHVGERVRSCPKAGCGKPARPV